MDAEIQRPRDHRFTIGLLAGAAVGVGLAMWLGPTVIRSTRRIGRALDELASRGQDARDDVADAVARGAHEVERFAAAAKSHRATANRTRQAADQPLAATDAFSE